MAGPRKLYIVRGNQIGGPTSGGWTPPKFEKARVERAFADRHDAEAFRDRLEREARASCRFEYVFVSEHNDFYDLFKLTRFDPPIFLDWLRDADIPVPEPLPRHGYDWYRWWEGCREQLTDRQLSKLYEGLHIFTFYEIVEVDWHDEAFAGDEPLPPELARWVASEIPADDAPDSTGTEGDAGNDPFPREDYDEDIPF